MGNYAQVDSKIPRGKAVLHSVLPFLAFILGPPLAAPVLAVTASLMAASVIGGGRFSLLGRLVKGFFKVAGVARGAPDALAPHRFAEAIGASMVLVAAILYAIGETFAGGVFALIVGALAALNASVGICVGCQVYLLAKRSGSRVSGGRAWS
ncbi:MAG: DUF4395 domain-containing protein [Actinomycetota bacterium]